MKQRLIVLSLAALCVAFPAIATAQIPCALPGFSHLPPSTTFALGPTMYYALVTYPDVVTALVGARDAWNVTQAAGRIGDWNGHITDSDCPAGQPLQIGAFDFLTTPCNTVAAYNAYGAAGFVDYFWWFCPQCGTKSVSMNLAYYWSTNPQPGQLDIQSVLTHELGHVLGLHHMRAGECTNTAGPNCAVDPLRNTMTSNVDYAETCWRDLNFIDVANADSLY